MLFGVIDWIISAFLNSIGNLLNVVWGVLCIPIYLLISLLYDVFTTIPQINLLKDIGIEGIYQRITMIMVIVMAFYITFEVVKYVVQPDIITDKEKGSGKLIQKIFIVILLLAFVPRIFSIAYDLQGRIIKGDVISVVLLGRNDNEEGIFKTLGTNFSANLFGLFYTLNPETCPNGADTNAACLTGQTTIDGTLNLLRGSRVTGAVGILVGTLGSVIGNFIPTIFGNSVINFSGLLALGIGIYALWTLIIYSIEVARRYFQLIYLQIMAPVAIIGYLAPQKDGMLSKWTKQCVTTYLDLFIRLLIINFVMLLSSILHNKFFGAESVLSSIASDGSNITWTPDTLIVTYLFLVIGLLTFALKAPKLLQELFPKGGAASGNFGLWEPTKSLISGTSRSVGGTLGSVLTGLDSWKQNKGKSMAERILGTGKATFEAAKAGFTKGGSYNKARAAGRGELERQEKIRDDGGTVVDSMFHGHREAQALHEFERENKKDETIAKYKDDAGKEAKGHKEMKYVSSHIADLERREIGNADSRGAYGKKMEKTLNELSYTGDYTVAKQKITADTKELYDSERISINQKAFAQTAAINENIANAQIEYNNADSIVKHYDQFVGPLTAQQQQEKTNAITLRDRIAQNIETEKQQLDVDTIKKLEEIEQNRRMKMIEIDQEEYDSRTTAISKLSEDADIKDRMSRIFEEGYTESAGDHIYMDENGQEQTIHIMTAAEEQAEADRRGVDKDVVHKEQMLIYIKNIGNIQESANSRILQRKQKPEYKAAKANAEASGKSGK